MSYWPRVWAAASAVSSRSSRSIRKDIFIDFSLFDAWRAGFRDVVFIIKREMEAEFREWIGDRMEQYFHVSYVFQELERLPEGISVPAGRTRPWAPAMRWPAVRAW